MKLRAFAPMPWDMIVFLTITTVGFGFSVRKIRYPELGSSPETQFLEGAAASRDLDLTTPVITGQVIDLGCLERKVSGEHVTAQDKTIRLKGKFCHLSRRAMKVFEGMKVKNLSNGYEGTIFFRGSEAAFVSDDLLLRSGRNLIQVEWRESRNSDPRIYFTEVFQK